MILVGTLFVLPWIRHYYLSKLVRQFVASFNAEKSTGGVLNFYCHQLKPPISRYMSSVWSFLLLHFTLHILRLLLVELMPYNRKLWIKSSEG